MIRLSRRNHDLVVVNLSTIAYVEANPDTLITLVTGERLHVRESVDEVVQAARAWQRDVHTAGVGVTEAR
jgi:flagellar protein FlbD